VAIFYVENLFHLPIEFKQIGIPTIRIKNVIKILNATFLIIEIIYLNSFKKQIHRRVQVKYANFMKELQTLQII
jgi:hypothetical protein